MSRRSKSSGLVGRWQVSVYETIDGRHPAFEFLRGAKVPKAVRRELLVTVAAVVDYGPLQFPTGTNRWRLMHKPSMKGEVDLSGICEARDKHRNILYRLFCVIDRDAPKYGLKAPALVLIGGAIKPAETAVPQKVYK